MAYWICKLIHTTLENFVSIIPGAMQLTRIPSDARVAAAMLLRPSNAVLLTA